jgi:transcriptional regulator with XRE-family HTH domain
MYTLQEKLGLLVKRQRKMKGLSTHDLAKKLGVSSGLINNIENSKNDVFKLDLLVDLVKELNINLDDIFVESIKINVLNPVREQNTIEITISNEMNKDIEVINKYISTLLTILLESTLKFEDTEEYLHVLSSHIYDDIKTFDKIQSLK